MKYIIKESQSKLILESGKINKVEEMIKNMGLRKASQLTGVPLKTLSDKFPGYITSNEAYVLIHDMFLYDQLPTEYKNYSLDMDWGTGVLYWRLEDENPDYFHVAATPFWDGNAYIPLDYEYELEKGESFDWEGNGVSPYSEIELFDLPPFQTSEDLKKWFISFYLPTVYLKSELKIKEIRESLGKH
jgi:hypothetical protein